MTIPELIRLMKSDDSRFAKPTPVDGMPDMVFACSFEETGVDNPLISEIVTKCPVDLSEFWRIARSAKLFEDTVYGQWGLSILDPASAVAATEKFRARRFRDYILGDLVVGRFIGDSDLLIVRCDPASSDFGSIVVATPIDPRDNWHSISESFADFLDTYIQAGGDKYWARS
ncbi:MAG: hypothetical protein ACK5UC_03300 [Planctomycetaceae bacterium]